jgi:hypothetical protein
MRHKIKSGILCGILLNKKCRGYLIPNCTGLFISFLSMRGNWSKLKIDLHKQICIWPNIHASIWVEAPMNQSALIVIIYKNCLTMLALMYPVYLVLLTKHRLSLHAAHSVIFPTAFLQRLIKVYRVDMKPSYMATVHQLRYLFTAGKSCF